MKQILVTKSCCTFIIKMLERQVYLCGLVIDGVREVVDHAVVADQLEVVAESL